MDDGDLGESPRRQPPTGEVTFLFTDLEGLNFRYFQVRVTFVANANLGVEPVLDGLGVVWAR